MINIEIKLSDFFFENKEVCINSKIESLMNNLNCCINLVSDKFNKFDTTEFDTLVMSDIYELERQVESLKKLLESIK